MTERILQINDRTKTFYNAVRLWYKYELLDRNLRLKYKKAKVFSMKVKTYTNKDACITRSRKNIPQLFACIDRMPIRRQEIQQNRELGNFTSDYSERSDATSLCFPNADPNFSTHISHCFSDATHHTCCLLGPNARKYSVTSGNPIGSIAAKVSPTVNNPPWCTCSGSQVCQKYAEKFKDGTRILFMYFPKHHAFYYNVPLHLEPIYTKKFGIRFHLTPGV